MSSNGDSIQYNSNEQPRGNSYRYRGGPRRGRYRGSMNDRTGQQRFQYANAGNSNRRHGVNPNEHPRGSQNEQESIDINDSSQFPSIQESSRASGKSGPINTTSVERQYDYGMENRSVQTGTHAEYTEFAQDSSSRRSSGSYRGYYQNVNSGYNSSGGSFRGRGGYSDRDYQSGGNRSRGRFHYGSTRGNQVGFGRRYSRPYVQQVPGMFIQPDPYYGSPPFVEAGVFAPYQTQTQYIDPMSSKPSDPVKQVEYYFSNKNLLYDFHLRSHMDKDGWVSLGMICKFPKMEYFRIDVDDIAALLTKSEQLEVDMDKKRIRTRTEPQRWPLLPGQEISQSPVNVEYQELESNNQEIFAYGSFYSPMDSSVNTLSYNTNTSQYGYSSGPYGMQSGYPSQNPRPGRYPAPFPYYQGYYPFQYSEIPPDMSYSFYPPPYSQSYYETVTEYGGEQFPSEEKTSNSDSVKQNIIAESSDYKTSNAEEQPTQTEELTKQVSELNISSGPVSC